MLWYREKLVLPINYDQCDSDVYSKLQATLIIPNIVCYFGLETIKSFYIHSAKCDFFVSYYNSFVRNMYMIRECLISFTIL